MTASEPVVAKPLAGGPQSASRRSLALRALQLVVVVPEERPGGHQRGGLTERRRREEEE